MLLKYIPLAKRPCLTVHSYRWVAYAGRGTPCLAIRRETINAWERRAPLAPIHVKKVV